MDFRDACTAVADLYEAIPETYIGDGTTDRIARDGTPRFCAVQGVEFAMMGGLFWGEILERLEPYKHPNDPAAYHTSNRSREDAIAMLRQAAKGK